MARIQSGHHDFFYLPVRPAFKSDVISPEVVLFECCRMPNVATKAKLSSEMSWDVNIDTFRLSSHITRLLHFRPATFKKINYRKICDL